jgi:hypothetical protein
MWRIRGRRMRSRHIGLCSHPCPVNKSLHVLAAYQETILQHILSAFVVVTKLYDLGIIVVSSFNPIVLLYDVAICVHVLVSCILYVKSCSITSTVY